jgi:hypothetical protein
MPTKPKAPAPSLVASLQPLLRSRKAHLTVGEMMAKIEGADGLGPVLFVLTLPVLLPLPPGFSMVLALPLLVVAPQIVVGRRRLWMPKALSCRTVDRPALVKLLRRILPLVKRVETVVRPRLGFLTGRIGARLVGVASTVIAIVLVLPIPFANLVPAVALGFFSLGLTRKDGLFVLAGYGLLVLAAAVIALGVHGFTLGFEHLWAFAKLLH